MAGGRRGHFCSNRTFSSPSVKDLCQDRYEKRAEREKKDDQYGYITGQMLQMLLKLPFFLFCPDGAGISRLHEELHEAVDMHGLIEDHLPVFLYGPP